MTRIHSSTSVAPADKGPQPETIIGAIQVNVPYHALRERYLQMFLDHRLNPEIGMSGVVLDQADREEMEHLAGLLVEKQATITLHGPFMDLAPGALDAEVLAASRYRLQQTIDLVPLFRPQAVVFHAGFDGRRYRGHELRWLEHSLATWEQVAIRAERLQTKVLLENVYEETPEVILQILTKIDSPFLGFCLDTGHANVYSRVSWRDWLHALGPYLGEVHLHDNRGDADAHDAIGTGTVPVAEVLQALRLVRPRPLLTLEPHQEEAFWQGLAHLGQMWPWDA